MKQFVNKQYIDIPIEKVWAFFSDSDNLEKLTPPGVKLRIIHTDLPKEVHKGQTMKYRLSPMLYIPMTWVTEITEVRERELFVDEQKKGPYKYWRHEHYFEQKGNGTLMTDIVHYKNPWYIPGFLADILGIKKKLAEIFEYRRKMIDKIFFQ